MQVQSWVSMNLYNVATTFCLLNETLQENLIGNHDEKLPRLYNKHMFKNVFDTKVF